MDIITFYDKSSDTFVSRCIHFLEYRSHIQFRCNGDKTQTIVSFLNRSVSQRRKLILFFYSARFMRRTVPESSFLID